jgi:hypothetical protein
MDVTVSQFLRGWGLQVEDSDIEVQVFPSQRVVKIQLIMVLVIEPTVA